jgi:predicted permease
VRVSPGTTPEVAAAAIAAVGKAIDARDFGGRGLSLYAVGLKADLLARVRPVLLVLAAAGAVLLLMLTVNLASVLLARAAQRQHEFAVSRALGAKDGAIARATLIEGGLLGCGGGAAGVLAAVWATHALVALAPADLPRRDTIAIDWPIAVTIVAVGALLGVLAAAVPAGWAARVSLSSLLASSAVRGGGSPGRMRRGLIVAQVALSLVLLTAGGLVARSVERLLRADPGFRPDGVLTMRIRTPPEFFPTPADMIRFQDDVEKALAAIPGVVGASAATSLPLTGTAGLATISIPGAPGNTGDASRDTLLVDVIGVRATYPAIMGMRLISGRLIDPVRRPGVAEALLDRAAARHFFPAGDPIGATLPFGRPDGKLTIVGVVEPARMNDVHRDGRPQLYIRSDDWGIRPLSFVVRTGRDPESIVPEVRAAVRQVDARVPVGDLRPLDQIVDATLRQQQTGAVLIAGFALGALLLAAMGLFGIVAGSVTQRRRELAVRLALGADYGRVLRLVIGDGALLVGIGCVAALPVMYMAGRLIRGMLVGVSPFDPLTIVAVAAALGVVTLVSCYLPARRVLRIEPAASLRQE